TSRRTVWLPTSMAQRRMAESDDAPPEPPAGRLDIGTVSATSPSGCGGSSRAPSDPFPGGASTAASRRDRSISSRRARRRTPSAPLPRSSWPALAEAVLGRAGPPPLPPGPWHDTQLVSTAFFALPTPLTGFFVAFASGGATHGPWADTTAAPADTTRTIAATATLSDFSNALMKPPLVRSSRSSQNRNHLTLLRRRRARSYSTVSRRRQPAERGHNTVGAGQLARDHRRRRPRPENRPVRKRRMDDPAQRRGARHREQEPGQHQLVIDDSHQRPAP